MNPLATDLLVKVMKCNKRGSIAAFIHDVLPKVEVGADANEMKVEDRLVFYSQVGGVPIHPRLKNGKLNPKFAKLAATQIGSWAWKLNKNKKSRKDVSISEYKQIVLSCPENGDPAKAEKEFELLYDAAHQFLAVLGVPGGFVFGHRDRKHCHCHIVIPNWNSRRGMSLRIDKRMLSRLLGLSWLKGYPYVTPAAYKYTLPFSVKKLSREPLADELAALIGTGPNINHTIRALKMKGIFSTYQLGGKTLLKYKGKKIGGYECINHRLKKFGSSHIFNSEWQAVPVTTNDLIVRHMKNEAAGGLYKLRLKEMQRYLDIPDPYAYCDNAADRAAIDEWILNGKRPKDGKHYNVLLRILRGTILRKAYGAEIPLKSYEPRWAYPECVGFNEAKFKDDIAVMCAALRRDMLKEFTTKTGKTQYEYFTQDHGKMVKAVLDGFDPGEPGGKGGHEDGHFILKPVDIKPPQVPPTESSGIDI